MRNLTKFISYLLPLLQNLIVVEYIQQLYISSLFCRYVRPMFIFQPCDPLLDRSLWESCGLPASAPHPPPYRRVLSSVKGAVKISLSSVHGWHPRQCWSQVATDSWVRMEWVPVDDGWPVRGWLTLICCDEFALVVGKQVITDLPWYHGISLLHPWKGSSVFPCKSFMQLAVHHFWRGCQWGNHLPVIPQENCLPCCS